MRKRVRVELEEERQQVRQMKERIEEEAFVSNSGHIIGGDFGVCDPVTSEFSLREGLEKARILRTRY